MPRGAKRNPLETLTRGYLDPRSFISRDGREFLYGEDMSVRRNDVYVRSGGFCETLGCERAIYDDLPSDHPNSLHVHHKKSRGKGGADNMDNLEALCKRCHSKKHADRNPQWSRA